MSMDHHKAVESKASERYLLGEMSELERFQFEAHYFDCAACADEVCTGAALARGIKAVCAEDAALRPRVRVVSESPRTGWFSWLSFPVLAPSAAALALGCVAVYQGFVLMPGLRLAGEVRGEEGRAAADGSPACAPRGAPHRDEDIGIENPV